MVLLCAGVMEDLRQKGAIEGWRDELYPVTESFNQEPLLLVERAAATYLGIKVASLPTKVNSTLLLLCCSTVANDLPMLWFSFKGHNLQTYAVHING